MAGRKATPLSVGKRQERLLSGCGFFIACELGAGRGLNKRCERKDGKAK